MATLTIRFPDVLKDKMKVCADEMGLSLNSVVMVAIDVYLGVRLQKSKKKEKRELTTKGQIDKVENGCQTR